MAWAASLSANAPTESSAPGFQQGQIYPGFQNQGLPNQPMNLGQQIGGQHIGGQQFGGQQMGGQMINQMFHADRAPHRHVEAYQQMPDAQPPHRQDADAYWADKIAEVMTDQFGIKPKVNTYSYRTPYPPAYDLISFQIGTKCRILPSFLGRMIHQPWSMSTGSSSSAEKLLTGTS